MLLAFGHLCYVFCAVFIYYYLFFILVGCIALFCLQTDFCVVVVFSERFLSFICKAFFHKYNFMTWLIFCPVLLVTKWQTFATSPVRRINRVGDTDFLWSIAGTWGFTYSLSLSFLPVKKKKRLVFFFFFSCVCVIIYLYIVAYLCFFIFQLDYPFIY